MFADKKMKKLDFPEFVEVRYEDMSTYQGVAQKSRGVPDFRRTVDGKIDP